MSYMPTLRTRSVFAVLFLLLGGLMTWTPARAVEDGLMNARIGASYREVMRKFHNPAGILLNAGGGLTYQELPKSGLLGLAAAPAGGGGGLPVWASPVRVAFLGDQQAEWLYDMRKDRGVTMGVVMSGEGADAVVTDIIISGYPEYLKGKRQPPRTEKGVTFGSTFLDVLRRYGFPPQIEIFTPGSAPAPVASRAAAPAAGRAGPAAAGAGAPGGRAGGMRGRRGGGMGPGDFGALPGGSAGMARTPSAFEVQLTQGMLGDEGGMGGGRMRGGRAGRAGAGRAPGAAPRTGLPPLGAAAASPAAAMLSELSASTMVNNQSISFSKDCILTYTGIAFTLHNMRVIRIHVSE